MRRRHDQHVAMHIARHIAGNDADQGVSETGVSMRSERQQMNAAQGSSTSPHDDELGLCGAPPDFFLRMHPPALACTLGSWSVALAGITQSKQRATAGA